MRGCPDARSPPRPAHPGRLRRLRRGPAPHHRRRRHLRADRRARRLVPLATRGDSMIGADRTEARRVLLAELDRHVQAGREVPCLTWPLAGWTSDDDAEQALAARLCPACPALGPCDDYG